MTDVARAVEGLFLGMDAEVSSVAIDSRHVVPGALFVALPGERTDGGRFVPEAFANGAAGVLVRDGLDVDGPAVSVRSTGEALMMLARDERSRMDANVVAVTGANGKTSTKDMTAAVLGTRFRTHASRESFNNEVGLPVTLLGAAADTEVVVAEMGARHVGDVAILCGIARPDIAIVTNVGVAHLEVFGSWERIVEASAEPIESLGSDGVAILNADDPVVADYAGRTTARVVTFGLAPDADVRAEGVSLASDGCASFLLVRGAERAPVTLAVPGEHMVSNALAAAAAGVTLGVPLVECAEALSHAIVSQWRMETFTTPAGVRVVNDAYNANPESMAAALRAARWMAGEGHLIAVLGPMAELGPIAAREHERIGELAARIRVDRLIAVGASARSIADAGMTAMVLGGIVSPANSPLAITVGALNTHATVSRSDDSVATYSSRGPTRGDLVVKPDVAAPGNKIISLQANASTIPALYPALHVAGTGTNAYMMLSGTSMAAPMVSGAAALLLQKDPTLTPDQVKYRLMRTASKSLPQSSEATDPVTDVTVERADRVAGLDNESFHVDPAIEEVRINQVRIE
jgi:UDP-N-acetylmuramoyl-tripeptide--D-alanyl-D-alanine ligase